MRIAISLNMPAMLGGAESYLRALIPLLERAGHALCIFCEKEVPAGTPNLVEGPKPVTFCVQTLGRADALSRLARWRPDVVYQQGLLDPSLEEALLRHFPCALYAHSYLGTCISGAKSHAFPRRSTCEREFGPTCLALYLPRRCGGLSPLTAYRSYKDQRQRLALLRHYPVVLVASRHMKSEYLRHSVPAERIRVVPPFVPGIEPDEQPPTPRSSSGQLLLVGRLTRLKGTHLLIRAMSIASRKLGRPLSLTVVGEGPERSSLEALARRQRALAAFTGWLDTPQLLEHMRRADLLVVPSIWPEPFGLVGIEAACVGLPSVGFAVGGIPEWLTEGGSGALAPADAQTPAALAEAIGRALGSQEHLQRLRLGAWLKSQRYSAAEHLFLLQQALEHTRSNARSWE